MINDTWIWQCEAYRLNLLDAAQKFAAEYWDRTRAIENFVSKDGKEATFCLADGIATYAIKYEYPNGWPTMIRVYRA